MSKDKTLHIFCFGDSLTAGYSAYGTVYHPYSIALTKKLSRDLSDTQVVATDNGMPGDVVSQGAFAKRFESEVVQTEYDWVIILGGTKYVCVCSLPVRRRCTVEGEWKRASHFRPREMSEMSAEESVVRHREAKIGAGQRSRVQRAPGKDIRLPSRGLRLGHRQGEQGPRADGARLRHQERQARRPAETAQRRHPLASSTELPRLRPQPQNPVPLPHRQGAPKVLGRRPAPHAGRLRLDGGVRRRGARRPGGAGAEPGLAEVAARAAERRGGGLVRRGVGRPAGAQRGLRGRADERLKLDTFFYSMHIFVRHLVFSLFYLSAAGCWAPA